MDNTDVLREALKEPNRFTKESLAKTLLNWIDFAVQLESKSNELETSIKQYQLHETLLLERLKKQTLQLKEYKRIIEDISSFKGLDKL